MRADFTSQAYFRDPAAEIEKLRSAGPVVEVQFPMVGKFGPRPRRTWPTGF